jgi:hypothetical protein
MHIAVVVLSKPGVQMVRVHPWIEIGNADFLKAEFVSPQLDVSGECSEVGIKSLSFLDLPACCH